MQQNTARFAAPCNTVCLRWAAEGLVVGQSQCPMYTRTDYLVPHSWHSRAAMAGSMLSKQQKMGFSRSVSQHGSATVGEAVVGEAVVGEAVVGEAVGAAVVGEAVGAAVVAVGDTVVGEVVGAVGADVGQ
jgi:hypothetical protein